MRDLLGKGIGHELDFCDRVVESSETDRVEESVFFYTINCVW